MPLVLVSNDANATDRYDWKDITGVQYHYPNGYRNMIHEGEPFIYYRGIRRADGSRGQAEYFGYGVIAEVWRDEDIPLDTAKRNWAWYCAIHNYRPFDPPISAKINGEFFEDIPRNRWRNGVRSIDASVFQRILAAAGADATTIHRSDSTTTKLPRMADVVIPLASTSLIVPRAKQDGNRSPSSTSTKRYSREARLLGDRAEAVAVEWIKLNMPGAHEIRWVAQEGLTPGWDIEFHNEDDELIAVEVKGASGSAFANFELTANELAASRRLGSRYLFMLVADCLGTSPRVEVIVNPAESFRTGKLVITATSWRVSCGSQ